MWYRDLPSNLYLWRAVTAMIIQFFVQTGILFRRKEGAINSYAGETGLAQGCARLGCVVPLLIKFRHLGAISSPGQIVMAVGLQPLHSVLSPLSTPAPLLLSAPS